MLFNPFSFLFRNLHTITTQPRLHHELMVLVHGQHDTAERLITSEKRRHPGKPESWYLEKVIYDLTRDA
ncbi:MAG: hypothetical protein WBA57_26845 [Elainellaceae cyanobacterium]